MYLAWYDDDKKKTLSLKISGGVSRYKEKFSAPNVVLMSDGDFKLIEKEPRAQELSGLEFRACAHVQTNNFFIGYEEKVAQHVQAKAS